MIQKLNKKLKTKIYINYIFFFLKKNKKKKNEEINKLQKQVKDLTK